MKYMQVLSSRAKNKPQRGYMESIKGCNPELLKLL